METVYYNLDARRVSVRDMASGETSPQCRSYAVLRKAEKKRECPRGEVLDLEAYRHARAGAQPEGARREEAPALPAGECAPVRSRPGRAAQALDLLATLAVLVMAAVVVSCFLPFL